MSTKIIKSGIERWNNLCKSIIGFFKQNRDVQRRKSGVPPASSKEVNHHAHKHRNDRRDRS